jgi:Uma2 family endonuclease
MILDRQADLAPERVRPLRRAEFERLVELGAFEDEPIELLEGVIVQMSPKSPRCADAVTKLIALLFHAANDRAQIRSQMPFAASEISLPEPDIALVPPGHYDDANPQSALLIVEVSLESLRKDRTLKADLYARAGVPEYWIVNLVDRCIEVRTQPVEGAYTRLETFPQGAAIPFAPFGATVAVSDVIR